MKKILFLLLLYSSMSSAQDSATSIYYINAGAYFPDTVHTLMWIQTTRRDVPMLRKVYIINGELWKRSCGLFTKNKWVRVQWFRYAPANGWIEK